MRAKAGEDGDDGIIPFLKRRCARVDDISDITDEAPVRAHVPGTGDERQHVQSAALGSGANAASLSHVIQDSTAKS